MPVYCPVSNCRELFQQKSHLLEHLEFAHRFSSQQISNVHFRVQKTNKNESKAIQDLDNIDAHRRDELILCNNIPQNPIPISSSEYEVAASTIGNNIRTLNNSSNRRSIRPNINQPLYRRIVEKTIVGYSPFQFISFQNEYNANYATLDEQYSGSESESQSFTDSDAGFKPSERIPQNPRTNYYELQSRDPQAADMAHCDLHGYNCSHRRILDESNMNYGFSSNSNNFIGDSQRTSLGHSNVMLRPENFQESRNLISSIRQDKFDASVHNNNRPLDQAFYQYRDKCSICEHEGCYYASSETCHNDSPVAENSSSSFAKPKTKYYDMIIDAIISSKSQQRTISQIYSFISDKYPSVLMNRNNWQNGIRHCLSLKPYFIKHKDNSVQGSSNWRFDRNKFIELNDKKRGRRTNSQRASKLHDSEHFVDCDSSKANNKIK